MEAKWLDDFVALADTRSFTRAAEICCSSQSALSRRIQALERWVEAPLIDRDAYPLQLTEAGQRFYVVAIGLRGSLEAARQIGRRNAVASVEPVRVVMQPDLNPSVLADMLSLVNDGAIPLRTRIHSLPIKESFARLCEDEADLFVLQQHARLPVIVDPLRFQSLAVGRDTLALYCSADLQRRAGVATAGSKQVPLPFLEYSPSAYLAQVVALTMSSDQDPMRVRCVCEADSSMAILAMVQAGLGAGFLPGSWVADDVKRGTVVSLGPRWQSELEIRLVRELPPLRRAASDQRKQALESLWARLEVMSHTSSPSSVERRAVIPTLKWSELLAPTEN
jgi:LysR family transcriptional regulator, hypochlorite-specific transcription factor HypT